MMNILLITRGIPGCGKSTWIEQNGFKPYTLSSDDLRLLYSPPINIDGRLTISQKYNNVVWETLHNILTLRMKNQTFVVVDATHTKNSDLDKYIKLSHQYNYKIFCVDFSKTPLYVAKERNMNREEFKQVPEQVIEKMYKRITTQKVPSEILTFSPYDEDIIERIKNDYCR